MNFTNKLILIVSTVLFCSSPWLSAEDDAIALLTKHLQKMDSLSANFEQTITDNQGELLQQATGLLKVKRPRRFYWSTEQPYEHLVVTDGATLWLYDIDLQQINKQPFTADMDKAPALLLSGELEQISKQYRVELLTNGAAKGIAVTERQDFQLIPLTIDSVFQRLIISFDKSGLVAMTLKDSFEQQTRIVFSNVTLNPNIIDELFQFSPPDGVDVIIDEP